MTTENQSIVRYALDADNSKFTVQAFATGLLAGFGHNPTIQIREFTGEVQCTFPALEDAAVRLVVKANSMIAIDDVTDKDRDEIERMMYSDPLETQLYPEIAFESTQVTSARIDANRAKARVVGDLTLHGVTRKALWIQAQLTIDEESLRAQGEFTLKQSDYRIKLISAVGGAIRVKNELSFFFHIAARRVNP